MDKAKEDDGAKMEKLQRQHDQLVEDMEVQKTKCQEVDAKRQMATAELVATSEKATAELRGLEDTSMGEVHTGAADVAKAVEGFMQNLPPSAAAQAAQAVEHRHPGTQEACADMAKEGRALQEKMYTEADMRIWDGIKWYYIA